MGARTSICFGYPFSITVLWLGAMPALSSILAAIGVQHLPAPTQLAFKPSHDCCKSCCCCCLDCNNAGCPWGGCPACSCPCGCCIPAQVAAAVGVAKWLPVEEGDAQYQAMPEEGEATTEAPKQV